MRGLDHLSFGEFVGFLARSPAEEAGALPVVADEAAVPPVAAVEAAAPPVVVVGAAAPQWRLTKLRHPALGNGGGGRRLLPPFKAWRPFHSKLLALPAPPKRLRPAGAGTAPRLLVLLGPP